MLCCSQIPQRFIDQRITIVDEDLVAALELIALLLGGGQVVDRQERVHEDLRADESAEQADDR